MRTIKKIKKIKNRSESRIILGRKIEMNKGLIHFLAVDRDSAMRTSQYDSIAFTSEQSDTERRFDRFVKIRRLKAIPFA